jgi:hypothetical protein
MGALSVGSGSRTASGAVVLLLLCLPFCLTGCSVLRDPAAASAASGAPIQIFDRSGRREAQFKSPNGNINCLFTASTVTNTSGTVRCEIAVKLWQPPVKPASCDVDWGLGLTLDSRAAVLCAGDTVGLVTGPIQLPYGTSIRFTPFTCTSEPSGVDCVNTVTHAGFLIGRERYEVRNP